MKTGGKILCFLLMLLMCIPAYGAEHTKYADKLFEIGLFAGTDEGYELDKPLTRAQSATMVVRLMGAEKEAVTASYDEVFDDVPSDHWAFPYVMYCYQNEITQGTRADEFAPEKDISAEEFITFALRLLGYTDIDPEIAYETAITVNLLGTEFLRSLQSADMFSRGDMIYIAYMGLMTKTTDGVILARVLADNGVITGKQADEFDVYKSSSSMDELLDELLK